MLLTRLVCHLLNVRSFNGRLDGYFGIFVTFVLYLVFVCPIVILSSFRRKAGKKDVDSRGIFKKERKKNH